MTRVPAAISAKTIRATFTGFHAQGRSRQKKNPSAMATSTIGTNHKYQPNTEAKPVNTKSAPTNTASRTNTNVACRCRPRNAKNRSTRKSSTQIQVSRAEVKKPPKTPTINCRINGGAI